MLPPLDTVDGHSVQGMVHGVFTTCYYHRVLVRDGTGPAVINIVKTAQRLTFYVVSYLRSKPGSWVPSGLTRVVVLLISLVHPPMM